MSKRTGAGRQAGNRLPIQGVQVRSRGGIVFIGRAVSTSRSRYGFDVWGVDGRRNMTRRAGLWREQPSTARPPDLLDEIGADTRPGGGFAGFRIPISMRRSAGRGLTMRAKVGKYIWRPVCTAGCRRTICRFGEREFPADNRAPRALAAALPWCPEEGRPRAL